MHECEQDFSFKSLFVPLTTVKVIHIIVIIGVIVFGYMLFNNFVWDDKTFITLNPDVYSLDLPRLFGQNMFNDMVFYRPFPAVYFALLYTLFTTNAFPYHLLQLLLHIVNTVLLYKFFMSFFKKEVSLFLCLVFLVHPMQVESVSYIAQTVSPLFFFFGIMALLQLQKKEKKIPLIKINLLLLCSMLTKETGIIYLFLTNLYLFLYKKSKWVIMVATSIITLVIYLCIRFGIGHVYFKKSTLIAPIANISISERLLSVPAVVFYYFKTFFYPAQLGIDQHWIITSPTFEKFVFPLSIDIMIVGFITLLGYYCFKKAKELFRTFLFFSSWLFIGLLFHSQIVPLDMTVADRWFYTTIVGLLGILGIVYEVLSDKKFIKQISLILVIVALVLFSFRTMVRNTDWHDAETLYTHDIAIDDNFDIENSIGWEYIQSQQYGFAIDHINKSIHFWPEWDKNWYNLGVAYHYSGKIDLAKAAYETALKHNPDYVQVQENLGYLLAYYYNANDAKLLLTKALDKFPQRPKLWYFRALANYKLGKVDEAKHDISQAYALNPYDQNIANIYTQIMNNIPIQFESNKSK